MNYISLCSGIEAASVAFVPLGWTPLAFSEIEKFPCAVLKHHYPNIPNHGDLSKFDWSVYSGKADIVCAGFPCQSFSIAGLRNSLEDSRGNLSLIGIRAIRTIRPRWVMLEQVPGVLSAPGNPFGCILAGLSGADAPLVPGTEDGKWRSAGVVSGPGYGLAWRVLNAEFFGVPQSRRRIFIVGYLGNWTYPAAVLFERESLQWNFDTRKKKGEEIAEGPGNGVTAYRWQNVNDGIVSTDKLSTLKSNGTTTDERTVGAYVMATGQGGAEILEGQVPCLNCNHEAPIVFENHGQDSRIKEVQTLPQLNAQAGTGGNNLPLVMSFKQRPEGDIIQSDKAYNISTTSNASAGNTAKIQQGASVRRLTPMECERAQGFTSKIPYTQIPYKGKPPEKCPDGPRYKAIGNSWAVPCAAWIGRRIQEVEKL